MRVLHLANVAGRASGGIGAVVHGIIQRQLAQGIDACLWFPGTPRMEREVCEITGASGVAIRAIPCLNLGSHILPYGLIGELDKARGRFDLVHQHGIWVPNSIFTCRIAAHLKLIISPHGLLEPGGLQTSRWKKILIANLYENRNLAAANCFVASSRQEAEGIRRYGLTQPVAMIPSGVQDNLPVSPERKASAAEMFKRKFGIAEETKILLFLSRIHPIKGLDLLLEALEGMKGELIVGRWQMIIAGPSELGHREELEAKSRLLKLEGCVKFLPALYESDKAMAFQAADFFILPSKSENFGLVVPEALAAGVPVIASRQTPWQILEERGCGFWVERTKTALMETLRRAMALSIDERRLMGARGHALVEEQFRWPAIMRSFEAVYTWVLGAVSAPPSNVRFL